MAPLHELILGGAKSGKSRRAEDRAAQWLAEAPGRSAVLIATALAGDDEMAARIARHQRDRAERVPALATVEASLNLAAVLRAQDDPQRLLLVDCLTLWLTQCLLPPPNYAGHLEQDWPAQEATLLQAVQAARSPLVFVSNEIGLGVMPMSREARRCIDALGLLHQRLAERCARVTLMVAGLPLAVKGEGA
ncbi:MAG TPA: bifunctional adenosylcobinamide kinase/adenosylcobinamide-phosphate guanylyltransferase [Burkholderiaceae bacterium]|nr:bifunctional adenosylcobinamide kinase/adenosylcobinamide-phosphate guanylyltransferase [Burkholderiaceae bacterium]